jgi:hypothetical protein
MAPPRTQQKTQASFQVLVSLSFIVMATVLILGVFNSQSEAYLLG